MTNARVENLYHDFKDFVLKEAQALERVDLYKEHNSSLIGSYGITKENYEANFELAESIKKDS
jgi:hypothetical protein